jgi:hypothetical protein
MIPAVAPLRPDASTLPDSGRDYFSSEPHYRAVAARVLAGLGEGAGTVLVAGDPPPRADLLAQAFTKSALLRYRPIAVSCGPQLGRHGLPGTGARPSPLLLFDAVHRLSEAQLGDLFGLSPEAGAAVGPCVLLADGAFLQRVPALSPLRERLSLCLRFQDLAADEVEGFIRHQLGTASAFPPEIVQAIARAAGGDPALVDRLARLVLGFSAGAGAKPSGGVPPRDAAAPAAAPPARPVSAPGVVLRRRPVLVLCIGLALSTSAAAALGFHFAERGAPAAGLSGAEIDGLLGRGDGFRAAGDIASARLFYERAADAGSGLAALRLGDIFDPGWLERTGVRGVKGDLGVARSWYRKARDLGDSAADRRLRELDGATLKSR